MAKDQKGHGSNKRGFGAERARQMNALASTATDLGTDRRTGKPRVKSSFNRDKYSSYKPGKGKK